MRKKSVARSRRSGTAEMRKMPTNRPSHSAGAPAKNAVPSAVAGTAPSVKRATTARSTSARLHQMRERLPTSIATVRTGTAERLTELASVHARGGLDALEFYGKRCIETTASMATAVKGMLSLLAKVEVE